MASLRNLHRHTRVAALANVQKLAARAALGVARDAEDKALTALASADAARDATLQFWQARLLAPALEPVLFGQLNRLLAHNETAYAEAANTSEGAQSKLRARQADLGEAEGRHSALMRTLVRARRKLHRKREEAAADARACSGHKRDHKGARP